MKKAVALEYSKELPAPIVTATGKGRMAGIIERMAVENGIQTAKMTGLADALVELEAGSYVPEEYYQLIAELLVFVYEVGAER